MLSPLFSSDEDVREVHNTLTLHQATWDYRGSLQIQNVTHSIFLLHLVMCNTLLHMTLSSVHLWLVSASDTICNASHLEIG